MQQQASQKGHQHWPQSPFIIYIYKQKILIIKGFHDWLWEFFFSIGVVLRSPRFLEYSQTMRVDDYASMYIHFFCSAHVHTYCSDKWLYNSHKIIIITSAHTSSSFLSPKALATKSVLLHGWCTGWVLLVQCGQLN